MRKRKIFHKIISIILGVIIIMSMVPLYVFAEQINDSVDIPTIQGGNTTETVEVISQTYTDNNKSTTTKITKDTGYLTNSGLTATYESTEITDSQNGKENQTISANSHYTVSDAKNTYTAEGGTELSISESIGTEGAIKLPLLQNKTVLSNSNASSNTAGTSTLPTEDDDKLKKDDNANYDQTTTTLTDRIASAEITEITTKVGDPVFIGEDGEIQSDSNNGYYYFYVNGYDGIGDDIDEGIDSYQVACNIVDKSENIVKTLKYETVYNMFVQYKNADNPDEPQNGKLTGGLYCVDLSTDAVVGYGYRKVNIADAAEDGYYTTDDAAKLRSIMNNGFVMGVDEQTGDSKPTGVVTNQANLAAFKAKLRKAQQNGTLTDKNLINAIDSIKWEQAAVATQMAIWTIANRVETENEQSLVLTTKDETINALASYLQNLPGEYSSNETQIITEEKFVNNLELIIGTKVASGIDNEHDVYNVDLKFSLDTTPCQNDNLLVKILDSSGKTISYARIPNNETDASKAGYAKIHISEEGITYYMLSGLTLTENSTSSLTLKLEGTQYLNKGVYILQSRTNDNKKSTSQNLIGVFEGDAFVDLSMNIKLKFNVDEAMITTCREWRTENTSNNNPNEKNDGKSPTSLSNSDLGYGGGNVSDNTDIPKTGDNKCLFIFSAFMLAGCIGIAVIIGYQRKRRN